MWKIFEKIIVQKIEHVTFFGFAVFLDIFKIFAEDCFFSERFSEAFALRVLPFSRFQKIGLPLGSFETIFRIWSKIAF